jgi:hypothetical protein
MDYTAMKKIFILAGLLVGFNCLAQFKSDQFVGSASTTNLVGTVPDSKLSGNIPLLNGSQTWTGNGNEVQGNWQFDTSPTFQSDVTISHNLTVSSNLVVGGLVVTNGAIKKQIINGDGDVTVKTLSGDISGSTNFYLENLNNTTGHAAGFTNAANNFTGTFTGHATNFYTPDNVKFWGAIGDGIHADTTNFQNAINNASTGINLLTDPQGVQIIIPAGTYLLTNLTLPDGVSLIGSGEGVTLLRKTTTTGDFISLVSSNRSFENNIIIRDLKISQVGTASSGAAIKITGSSVAFAHPQIQNVLIYGTYYGLDLSYCIGGFVFNVNIDSTISDGIKTSPTFNNVSMISVYSSLCGGNGFRLSGDYDTFFSCSSDSSGGSGVYADVLRNSSWLGGGTEGSAKDGFTLTNCSSIKIQSLVHTTNGGRDGIRIDGGAAITLENCWVDSGGYTPTGYNLDLVNGSGAYPSRVLLLNCSFTNSFASGMIHDPTGQVIRIADEANDITALHLHIINPAASTTGDELVNLENDSIGGTIGDGTIINFSSKYITTARIRMLTQGTSPLDFAMAFFGYEGGLNEGFRLLGNGKLLIGTTTDDGVHLVQVSGTLSASGFTSYATNATLVSTSTTISNSQPINMTVYLTAATGLSMTSGSGSLVFSGQTIAAFTPFTLQPKAQLVGTAITCVGTNAW